MHQVRAHGRDASPVPPPSPGVKLASLGRRHGTFPGDEIAKVCPFEILHRQKTHAILAARIVNRDDIGMH